MSLSAPDGAALDSDDSGDEIREGDEEDQQAPPPEPVKPQVSTLFLLHQQIWLLICSLSLLFIRFATPLTCMSVLKVVLTTPVVMPKCELDEEAAVSFPLTILWQTDYSVVEKVKVVWSCIKDEGVEYGGVDMSETLVLWHAWKAWKAYI